MIAADWQSGITVGIVIITALLFLWRAFRPKKLGCSNSCGCSPPKKPTSQKLKSSTD